jgi:uncharacterized protein
MIIDAHVYALPARLRNVDVVVSPQDQCVLEAVHRSQDADWILPKASFDAITKSMSAAGIDISVLVSFPWASDTLCTENNDYILAVAKEYKQYRAICSLQPMSSAWRSEVEACVKRGCDGFKVNPAWQGFDLLSDSVVPMVYEIMKQDKFLMVHIDHAFKKSLASAAHLFEFAKMYPQLKIIAAHMGGMLGAYNLFEPVSKNLGNIWFDTAVSATIPMVKWYAEAGLEDKLLFGTDFPFNHCHRQTDVVEEMKKLGLSDECLQKIFSGNYMSLVGEKASCVL